MPTYSGVWNLVAVYQAKANLQWPQGPGAPTSVTALGGDTQATISFTAPAFTGVPPGIVQYRAISSPGGITATGASSPLTVTGLTNGTPYTFSVDATNGVQFGPSGISNSVTPEQLQRALFGGGYASTYVNTIDYVDISSTANAVDFGDLTLARWGVASCASATRGIWAGGEAASRSNVIDFVTIASAGNAADFGDLSVIDSYSASSTLAACSNSTVGVIGGGENAGNSNGWNVIQYVTIASTGNSINFGDLTVARKQLTSCGSPTRGVFGGGRTTVNVNTIDYVTIASPGNATSFGALSVARTFLAACSSATRGVFGGGDTGSNSNVLDYITIASTGNATDFGDLLYANYAISSTAGLTRGLFAGGTNSNNTINYITIASTGNAIDFGDLTQGRYGLAACSNAHGGL